EFWESNARSMAPTSSLLNKTFCHVAPPSRERNTPRSGLAPYAWPSAATNTTLGFLGSTNTRPIWRVPSRPRWDQVLPASIDLYMPLPYEICDRMSASPVPTYTMFGLEGATAMAPIEAIGCESKIGAQVRPELVDFHTPPPTDPK